MAITLINYYNQVADNNLTGLYSQPGGVTIPNPNDPNNNRVSKYLGGLSLNGPLITRPVTKGAIGSSGEGLLSQLATGGIAGFDIPGVDNLAAAAIDTARISKFFTTTPEGGMFLLKQTGLQRMNTKNYFGGGVLKLDNDTQIYNLGINTLLQVPLTAGDVHINRHGMLPSFLEYPNNKGVYSEYYKKLDADIDQNKLDDHTSNSTRLIELNNKRLGLGGPGVNVGDEWFGYNGGPQSLFGIGRTIHKRWSVSPDNYTNKPSEGVKKVSNQIIEPRLQVIPIISTTALNGLPKNLADLNLNKLSLLRTGIGDPGSRTSDQRKDLRQTVSSAMDGINYLSLMKGPKSQGLGQLINDLISSEGNVVKPEDLPKDLIKFRIEAIDNDNPDESIYMIFRAFLSGISDRYSGEWASGKYVGRGEKMYKYEGFDRDISLNFVIAPQTRQEMKPLIQKLNFLASNTAPDYNIAGRMRGSFTKLTVGDYFVSLPGFIPSLTYAIKDNSPWDIALYKDSNIPGFSKDERELPMMIDVAMTFKPIHNFLPKKGTNDVFYTLGEKDEWITELPSMITEWKK